MKKLGTINILYFLTSRVDCIVYRIEIYIILFVPGTLYFEVQDTLRVEGRLHANGEPGQRSSGGGGAGGSMLMYIGHLDGSGSIEVTGGNGK